MQQRAIKKLRGQHLVLFFFLNHLGKAFRTLKARIQTELWLDFFFQHPGQGLSLKAFFLSKGGRTKNDVDHPNQLRLTACWVLHQV